MKLAVTGATGQLGRLVVGGLLQRVAPENIVAVVRDAVKAGDLAAQGVSVRVAPYDDRPALEAALGGVDKVLLISGSEVGKRVPQHQNLIDAAKSAGVEHVAYTSAPKATTSPLILAPEHKATEEYLTVSGLGYTILRNSWYTENYVRTVETAKQTGTIVAAVGEGRVASATRADYAAGAVAVLLGEGHDGKVYELSGDYAWDYDELAAVASKIIGNPVSYQPVDGPTLVDILTGAGMERPAAEFVAALDGNIAAGLLSGVTGEVSALIGRPTTPLEEGLRAAMS
ncbi:MAG: SDR family oxidoreductase [Thermoleophilia bacterium]|nr:SDR family oxidoreductase [Thermoleophilia bacterium]